MRKRIVRLCLVAAICICLYTPSYAFDSKTSNLNSGYMPYSDAVTSPKEQDRAEKEFFSKHPNITNSAESKILRGPDPGNGSVDISTTGLFSSGTIYWDSTKSGTLSSIANIAMSLYGGTVGTVISVVAEVLKLSGITDQAEQSKPSIVKVGHSISYRNTIGQFYYNSYWYKAVTIQQRYFYEHLHSTVVINGQTRQLTVDKIPSKGYSPYLTESKFGYNDTAYISQLAIARYNDKVKFGYFAEHIDTWVD